MGFFLEVASFCKLKVKEYPSCRCFSHKYLRGWVERNRNAIKHGGRIYFTIIKRIFLLIGVSEFSKDLNESSFSRSESDKSQPYFLTKSFPATYNYPSVVDIRVDSYRA